MAGKIPVSVIIAARNEERSLPSCLDALRDFDEIIVVDSASTDRTAAVAEEHGAIVVPFIWNGRYPKKRQWCLESLPTRHKWVFFVDADEVLTAPLIAEISALRFDCAGYFVRGRYIWNGRRLNHGLKNNKLVLLHRDKFQFPAIDDLDLPGMGEMEGHYQPVLRSAFASERIGTLRHELDHHAAQSAEAWLERHRRYASWERGVNARKAWPADPVPWRQGLKTIFRALPCRGPVAFLYSYVLKRGFLDGGAGLDFARKRAAYYKMIGRL